MYDFSGILYAFVGYCNYLQKYYIEIFELHYIKAWISSKEKIK